MTLITPGIDYLARSLAVLALPSALTLLVRHLSLLFDFFLPTWLLISVFVLSIPLYTAIRIIYIQISERREAAAMGARVAPKIRGKWIGNADILRVMLKNWRIGYPADGLLELLAELGSPFNFYVFWEDILVTDSPEHVKLILATDFNNYVKGERFHQSMGAVLGTGVFNSDGEMWKFHRSMTRPFFSRDRISHFELFDRHAEAAITQAKLRLRAGYAIDIQDLMSRFTLDSATETLFGSCVHSLSAGLPYPHQPTPSLSQPQPQSYFDNLGSINNHQGGATQSTPPVDANTFATAFLNAQLRIAERERLGWVWPLLEIFGDKTKEPMEVVNRYLDPIVRDALRKRKGGMEVREGGRGEGGEKRGNNVVRDVGDDETLLDHLVKLTSDPVVLKDETLNIAIAGRDTTAATLTFIVYFLSIYPAITARLREEILSKVGPTARPNFDDIRDMKFLRAVINETLRLYPVVPFNLRESVNATTWPSADPTQKPIYVPAGTKVMYSVFMMHRRKDLWGPDAEEFDPDRFLDDRVKKYLTPNPFIFLPFNAGPRICLGQQFAYYEISFMIIRLLQSFGSFSLDPHSSPPDCLPPPEWRKTAGRKAVERFFPKMHLTMYSAGGLWVKMQEVDSY